MNKAAFKRLLAKGFTGRILVGPEEAKNIVKSLVGKSAFVYADLGESDVLGFAKFSPGSDETTLQMTTEDGKVYTVKIGGGNAFIQHREGAIWLFWGKSDDASNTRLLVGLGVDKKDALNYLQAYFMLTGKEIGTVHILASGEEVTYEVSKQAESD